MKDRSSEWFVPQFGPDRFRKFIGLLFLPYTGMVLSFSVIGAMLAESVHWERVLAAGVIYFLGLGIGAHALDAVGSKGTKPWGRVFSDRGLWMAALSSITAAYLIAIYYMIFFVPLLWIMAVLEGFFVFAYNLEWFRGKFHHPSHAYGNEESLLLFFPAIREQIQSRGGLPPNLTLIRSSQKGLSSLAALIVHNRRWQ